MSLSGKELLEDDILSKRFIYLTDKKNRIINEIRHCKEHQINLDKILKDTNKELNETLDNIIENEVRERVRIVEEINLLSEDEVKIITRKMDKCDYSSYGLPRFQDLERICKRVIKIKKIYPMWVLIDLDLTGQQDSLPPATYYRYHYKDENGFNFTLQR